MDNNYYEETSSTIDSGIKSKIYIIILVFVVIIISIILYTIIKSTKEAKNEFSNTKANIFKNDVIALLNEAYMAKIIDHSSKIDCHNLAYYRSNEMGSCEVNFISEENPTITIEGAGNYKEYCVYNGTMDNLDVVRCRK